MSTAASQPIVIVDAAIFAAIALCVAADVATSADSANSTEVTARRSCAAVSAPRRQPLSTARPQINRVRRSN